jgi:hypothetical protein
LADITFTYASNPFALLDVSIRDDRQKIVQAAEIASLTKNQNECSIARLILTNPRDRIHAELSWLPGISPRRATEFYTSTSRDTINIVNTPNIPQLCKINLICWAIEHGLFSRFQNSLVEILDSLTELVDSIDLNLLQKEINEDRVISKFAPISDIATLKDYFFLRLKGVVSTVMIGLDSIATNYLVQTMGKYAETWTSHGHQINSPFAEALLDSYDAQSCHFLSSEASSIKKFVEKERASGTRYDNEYNTTLSNLKLAVGNWGSVARPVQLLFEARGQNHSLSNDVCHTLMSFAFYLTFERVRDDLGLDLANICLNEFSTHAALSPFIKADIIQLEKFKNDLNACRRIEIGFIFKTPIQVSNRALVFKKKSIDLANITRLRWSQTTINQDSTAFRIGWGSDDDEVLLLTFRTHIFTEFRDLLLNLAGYRLITTKLTNELSSGRIYEFPNIAIADDHVRLRKRGLFSGVQYRSFGWKSISISTKNDRVRICAMNEPSFYAEVKFLNYWNVNLLAMLIRDNLERADISKLSLTFEQ